MIYPLLITALSPVLLLQGLYVRKVTPRLPEASGERSGQSGAGATLRLLILGDSAAAGVGVRQQRESLSGQLAAQLAADHQVDWQLWAKNGYRSRDLVAALEQQTPRAFDVAIISVGVNDVTGLVSQKKWLIQQQQIMALLLDKFSVQRIIFTALPPMHLFPALPQPLRWVLGLRAKQFNRRMQGLTEATGNCSFLAFNTPLQAEFMAEDGFHPSARTYALWAQAAAELISINKRTA